MVLRGDPEAVAAYRVVLADEAFTPQTDEDVVGMSDDEVHAAISNALLNAIKLGPGFAPAQPILERLLPWRSEA
jgi:hypothetical protein